MNNAQQDFEKLFRTELESVKFEIPEDQKTILSPVWLKLLEVNSLAELNIDVATHAQLSAMLLSGNIDFNLFNASFLFNSLSQTAPAKLGVSLSNYSFYIAQSQELSNKWNEIVSPIRNKLINKMQTQAALQVNHNGKNVIPVKGR